MKPTRIRRIAAAITIGAAALTGTLLTTSTASADTWWGSHPTTAVADGTPGESRHAAAPADTWWG